MFENTKVSPICLVSKEEERIAIYEKMREFGVIVAEEYTTGSFFNEIQTQFTQVKLTAIIVGFGYIKNYET